MWLLLHLKDVSYEVPIPRADVCAQLEQELQKQAPFSGFKYAHGKKDVVDAVMQVGDEQAARQRAEVLTAAHDGRSLLEANPSTQVHLLVKSLREWIAYYGYGK